MTMLHGFICSFRTSLPAGRPPHPVQGYNATYKNQAYCIKKRRNKQRRRGHGCERLVRGECEDHAFLVKRGTVSRARASLPPKTFVLFVPSCEKNLCASVPL